MDLTFFATVFAALSKKHYVARYTKKEPFKQQ